MRPVRQCSRTACGRPAVATLTYVYADQTAVLGPLATLAEPHSYDLCAEHASRLTAPRGWEVVRLTPEFVETGPSHDDLLALADAVREAGRPPLGGARHAAVPDGLPPASQLAETETRRRGHLRVLRGEDG
ncbi:DUF3499 domain-containing protein [Cellulomonas triticagri]|uniref:DUF3499 domain-containing protein n=1 Tax=Cellulomonas triticagri TaxID=2483352 RepID=A0A3M2IP35_9CELL|nr:DUF3499 domain-containing protein [Cellulomonas triticagri]RMI03682.1 DUF3499 domain-containing protein [Cellulomonas triticagri]